MKFLYHGSTIEGLKTLEPQKRYTPSSEIEDAAIYATPLPAFAAAHSFPWSSDEGFDIEINDDKVTVIVPKAKKERLEVGVSIYKISADHFQLTEAEGTGRTWHATQSINVVEEVRYNSAEEALLALGATLSFK